MHEWKTWPMGFPLPAMPKINFITRTAQLNPESLVVLALLLLLQLPVMVITRSGLEERDFHLAGIPRWREIHYIGAHTEGAALNEPHHEITCCADRRAFGKPFRNHSQSSPQRSFSSACSVATATRSRYHITVCILEALPVSVGRANGESGGFIKGDLRDLKTSSGCTFMLSFTCDVQKSLKFLLLFL